MTQAIIIDDEPYCCRTLEALLQRHCPQITITGIFNDGVSALSGIVTRSPQIVFLDIEMPRMNGFELLQQLPEVNFELIFTTSYDQYAIKALHFSALDYLLKPIDRTELQAAVNKAVKRKISPTVDQINILMQKLTHPADNLSKVALPTMEGLQMISFDTIISCASEGNYSIFYLKGPKKIMVSRILKDVEEMLGDRLFIRVHNSYLVNINEIDRYVRGEGGYLVMSDGSSIDVSRSRKEALIKKLSGR